AGVAAEDTDRLEVGQAGAQLADHLHVVEALEARGADEGPALRESQDVVDLAAAKVGPDLVRDRAEPLEREEDVRELHPVRKLDRDDVARADPERREARGHTVDPRPELRVGDPAPAVDDRDAVWMGRGARGQDRVKGLGAPVPGLLVARDEV